MSPKMNRLGFLLEKSLIFHQQSLYFVDKSLNTWDLILQNEKQYW